MLGFFQNFIQMPGNLFPLPGNNCPVTRQYFPGGAALRGARRTRPAPPLMRRLKNHP
jgi:hypothetical protein